MQNGSLIWGERPTRRIKLIENALKNDPFIYHKRKNVISTRLMIVMKKMGKKQMKNYYFAKMKTLSK